jgi:hypothetical protein
MFAFTYIDALCAVTTRQIVIICSMFYLAYPDDPASRALQLFTLMKWLGSCGGVNVINYEITVKESHLYGRKGWPEIC